MTQHHDPVHPDSGDRDAPADAVPVLSPADEAYVTGLLGELPPVEMPPDVAASLDAALARESSERALADGGEQASDAGAAATVVPFGASRGRRAHGGTPRRTRVLQAAAAIVLVVGGGVVAVDVLRSEDSAPSSSAGSVPPPVAAVPVERTGHTYTDASLQADVQELTTGTLPTDSGALPATGSGSRSSSSTPAGPSSSPTLSGETTQFPSVTRSPLPGVEQYIFQTQGELVPCLAAVEEGLPTGVAPVAMDQGTYKGQPVLVVVLPGYTDPENSYDVYIVGEDCGKDSDAHMLRFQSVPKP